MNVIKAISTVARLLLAGVWLYAGGSKVTELNQSVLAVNAYDLLPAGTVSQLVGNALPFLEIGIGLLLLLGLFTRFAAVASAVLFVIFLAGIGSAWARGLQIDCGCFGGGGALAAGQKPEYFAETFRDIGLLVAAVILSCWPRTWLSLDGWLLGTTKEQL